MDGSTVHTSVTSTSQSPRDIFLNISYIRAGGRRCEPTGKHAAVFSLPSGQNWAGVRTATFHFVTAEHGTALKASLPCIENKL